MIFRLLLLTLVCLGSFAWQAPAAEAGWLANRRAARGRAYYRPTRSRVQHSRSTQYSRSTSRTESTKPHMTQSRSAVLDGFFGPGPGMEGYDRSWYIGR